MNSTGRVADCLDLYLEKWLNDHLRRHFRFECEALVELIRSADLHAYFLYCFPRSELPVQLAQKCRSILTGIGPALRAFLPSAGNIGDGIPWPPSSDLAALQADCFLYETGQLTMLRRLAHGERYGLVRCEFHSEDHVSIHRLADDVEELDRDDASWLDGYLLDKSQARWTSLSEQIKGWARDRIDEYVSIDRSHFIRYESDWDLLTLYQQCAESLMLQSAEADSLPDDARLGPRLFGEWKQLAITAIARANLHLSFATRLNALNRDRLSLRNLLTIVARREDLRAVWREQTGITDESVLDDVEDVFTLTHRHANDYFANHDYPLPYSIRFGNSFAVLPQFGYLANSCAFLTTQLKEKYRSDWDKAVNLREQHFQRELYALLSEPNYLRGRENITIRNSNGNIETDIDAVILDRTTNHLYLFQLKWFDVFGHSLRERQSKLSNLLKANKWVAQVADWLASRPTSEILNRAGLNLSNHSGLEPQIRLVVLTRYTARFSGAPALDERAAWLSWPSLFRTMVENSDQSPLEAAWRTARTVVKKNTYFASKCTNYSFQGLKVDLHI